MPRESEFLLIDVSNSLTKIAPSSPKRLGRVRRVPTAQLGVKVLHDFRAAKVVLSSVVPEKTRFLRAFFRDTTLVEVNHRTDLGVGIEYPNPRSIGADRLANAACAAAIFFCALLRA